MTSSNGSSAAVDAQEGMFDHVIEDGELSALLEERERRRAAKSATTAKFKEKDDEAKGRIRALEIDDGTVVRCGRFRIKATAVASRSVAFDTAESRRLTITFMEEAA